MPNWTNYYSSYDTATFSDSRSASQIQQEFEECQYQRERHDLAIQQTWEEHQQRMDELKRELEERKEDERKHPLFYWKQTCKKGEE